ncbi:hypothetical protein [Halobaculum lipolyticum]|uniref:hypothetical protein n=1 Tax=Halobaculum lipolyticum TaxID=3032001 RepID=UPI0024C4452D|nr:hypothetical protein [Halobaculum sp. DT31]
MSGDPHPGGGTDGDGPTPADGADPARCGCAGKTPLERVVFPARERVAERLVGTGVELDPPVDAATFPRAERVERETALVRLGGDPPPAPFADAAAADPGVWAATERDGREVVTLACVVAGDDAADADRLGDALADAYTALDGPRVRIGKGHTVQAPGVTGGHLWLEHLRPVGDDAAAGGRTAASVDAVHAFPALGSADQARIAALNALNDVHAAGATADRTVRPVVAAPAADTPDPARVEAWYRAGVPDDVTVLAAAVVGHDGDGWLVGASATAAGASDRLDPRLPDDCGVLLTRPVGGLACFARGVADDDEGLRERGLAHLRRDGRAVAAAVAGFRPAVGERFDPAAHVARVTDVSGEGIAGVGRLAAASGRSLRLRRLPILEGAAAATTPWAVPDATVETNGPLAVAAAPAVLDRLADELLGVDGADPRRVGTLGDDDAPVVNATGTDLSRAVEAAARWPTAATDGGEAADGGGGGG